MPKSSDSSAPVRNSSRYKKPSGNSSPPANLRAAISYSILLLLDSLVTRKEPSSFDKPFQVSATLAHQSKRRNDAKDSAHTSAVSSCPACRCSGKAVFWQSIQHQQ